MVGKLSEVPPDAEFLVFHAGLLNDPAVVERLQQRMGFRAEIFRLTDETGREHALWTRRPEQATAAPQAPTEFPVQAAPAPLEKRPPPKAGL